MPLHIPSYSRRPPIAPCASNNFNGKIDLRRNNSEEPRVFTSSNSGTNLNDY